MARRDITVRMTDLQIVQDMIAAIGRVRDVHARNVRFPYFCVNCRSQWPCRTIRALDSVCCDMHNRNCEPPSELCCRWCTEASHPSHGDGTTCSALDLSRSVTTPTPEPTP